MRNPQWRMSAAAPDGGHPVSLRLADGIHKGATPSIRVLPSDYVCLVLGSEPQGSPGPIV